MFEAAGTSNVAEHNEQRTNFNSTPVAVGPRPHYWGRPLAIAAAVVFFISLVFPVTAGLWGNKASFPRWWGPLDVGIAFVLVILAFTIITVFGAKVNRQAEAVTYRTYRLFIHGILAMIIVFFLL